MATYLERANWLQAKLGNGYEVIPLEFADKIIMYLNCIMTIIGNGKGIIHKNLLKLPLPFLLNLS